MPLSYIPTMQNPLAGSNLGNVASALKAPSQAPQNNMLTQSTTGLQNSISNSIPDDPRKLGQGMSNLFSNGNLFPSSTFLNAGDTSGPGFMNF